MDKFYNQIRYRKVPEREYTNIVNTLNEFYDIKEGRVSFYNPNLKYFSNYFTKHLAFNNSNKLIKLVKKKHRINALGYIYKAKLITSNRRIYHNDIFIKELPLVSLDKAHLLYIRDNYALGSSMDHLLCDSVYNLNSSNNIEIFVSYLVSKLTEANLSPNFCKYYGCYRVTLDKFTFDIDKDSSMVEDGKLEEILVNNESNCKLIHNNGELFVEFRDYPTYLLATEKLDIDIDFLYEEELLDYNFITSIIFQTFAAIVIMYNTFGIKHNDLHLSNIMLSITDKQYIYYKVKDKYYKIPTYGYIVKIIDWGRATYDFNGYKGRNTIFDFQGDCYGQYRYKRINLTGTKTIMPEDNEWTDIIMVSHGFLNLLEDYRDSEIGKMLTQIVTHNKGMLDIDDFNWDIYKEISNNKFNVEPAKLFSNKIFKQYQMVNEEIVKIDPSLANTLPKTNNTVGMRKNNRGNLKKINKKATSEKTKEAKLLDKKNKEIIYKVL